MDTVHSAPAQISYRKYGGRAGTHREKRYASILMASVVPLSFQLLLQPEAKEEATPLHRLNDSILDHPPSLSSGLYNQYLPCPENQYVPSVPRPKSIRVHEKGKRKNPFGPREVTQSWTGKWAK